LHGFLEAAGFAGEAGGADLVDEEVVELAGFFWWGGGVEGGALAASYVAVEGELGDGEDAAAAG
jgi:hypothetical protein